jgi:predicted transcriptional regulator
VVDYAYPTGEKAYTTVQTIMTTLVRKNILSRKKTGLVHFYKPLYTRKQMISGEMSNLLARGFHNSVPALANFLFDSEKISLDDIVQMKQLLQTKENELRRRS